MRMCARRQSGKRRWSARRTRDGRIMCFGKKKDRGRAVRKSVLERRQFAAWARPGDRKGSAPRHAAQGRGRAGRRPGRADVLEERGRRRCSHPAAMHFFILLRSGHIRFFENKQARHRAVKQGVLKGCQPATTRSDIVIWSAARPRQSAPGDRRARAAQAAQGRGCKAGDPGAREM